MRMFAALVALCLPTLSQAACPPAPFSLLGDRAVRQGASCAFTGAHHNDNVGKYEGEAAIDIGGGLVGQKLIYDPSGCDHLEDLVVLDCAAGEMAAFSGTTSSVAVNEDGALVPIVGPSSSSIRALQPPHGPLALSSQTTLTRLIALAEGANIHTLRDPEELFAAPGEGNRFDVWCGCKRFYPGSAGASK
ncbi:MAG: hypothetical protein ACU0DW_10920 [Shimia sp.]